MLQPPSLIGGTAEPNHWCTPLRTAREPKRCTTIAPYSNRVHQSQWSSEQRPPPTTPITSKPRKSLLCAHGFRKRLTFHSGIDDNALAQRVLLRQDQPTYHYVEPDALLEPKAHAKEQPYKWCTPPLVGSLILMVALGIGATALIMVSKGDGDTAAPKTGASTADATAIPPGLVAPFILKA